MGLLRSCLEGLEANDERMTPETEAAEDGLKAGQAAKALVKAFMFVGESESCLLVKKKVFKFLVRSLR